MSEKYIQTLSVLADGDCPSDWGRGELLIFAQDAARRLLYIRTAASTIDATVFNPEAEIDAIKECAAGDRTP